VGTGKWRVRVEEQAVKGKDPKWRPVLSMWEKWPHVEARKGSHGMVVIKYCVSGGCLLSVSICRWGFQVWLKVRPSSLFMLCRFISNSLAYLMS